MFSRRINLVSTSRFFIIPSIFYLALALFTIWFVGSESRDIRPSNHGLPYQKGPRSFSPELLAFFNGSSDVAFPEAKNLSDPFWGISGVVTPATSSRHLRDGRGHVREILLIASLACGALALAFLVVTLSVFLFRARSSNRERCWHY